MALSPVAGSQNIPSNPPKQPTIPATKPACCGCWYTSANVAGDYFGSAEGINKTSKLGSAFIGLISKLYGTLADGWYALNTTLKGVASFLDVADVIIRITEFARGEVKGAWKIASRICLTAFRVFNLIDFLEKVKLINLRGVIDTLGNIPVLGWIINLPSGLLGLASFSLSLVHNSLQVKKDVANNKLQVNMRSALEARKNALNETDPAKLAALKVSYEKAVAQIRDAKATLGELKPASPTAKTVEQRWTDRVATRKGEANLKARMDNCDKAVYNAGLSKGKNIVGIINDIIKVAIIALSLAGLMVGGLLAFTSVFMLSFGLAASLMGVYKCFHDKIAKDSMVKITPVKV